MDLFGNLLMGFGVAVTQGTTNANGVGQFTLDARGTTYGYYIPVDVTCSGRGLTMTARTGFTPVRAAR